MGGKRLAEEQVIGIFGEIEAGCSSKTRGFDPRFLNLGHGTRAGEISCAARMRTGKGCL